MSQQPDLIIGDLVIPVRARTTVRQSYEPLGGVARFRLSDGTLVQQTHWRRLRTLIQGTGWVPPGLDLLDYDSPVIIDCINPRSVWTPATAVVIPGAVRPDADLVVHAVLGTDDYVQTEAVLDAGTATITPVPDAQQYLLRWYPRLTCYLDRPEDALDAAGADWDWQLTAEEI
ncbi:MAG: hypothetical protein JJU06_05730 [Ectothiorhodospiraceae bacterium]|nr:hypothetical protein [Ectothiorhodospiraceae bacterium]MCH8502925.1 hypothetical protein [Ectothiorhodospiraceae bacterium]